MNARTVDLEAATFFTTSLIKMHSVLMFYSIITFILVLCLLVEACYKFNFKNNPNPSTVTDNWVLETCFIMFPLIIVIILIIPSFILLYSSQEQRDFETLINIQANQWYWAYDMFVAFIDDSASSIKPKCVEEKILFEKKLDPFTIEDARILYTPEKWRHNFKEIYHLDFDDKK